MTSPSDISSYQKDFADFKDDIWLNAASEGPLPNVAVAALQEAVAWKKLPQNLTLDKFARIPTELKESIGRLINVSPRDVILGNSASYGLHLLANGLPWKEGDEIIVMQNDFPTDILPWLGVAKQGVCVTQLPAKNKVLTPEELEAHITKKTKLFCISHIHTFSGITLDVKGLGDVCRRKKIIFVLNLSQSAGTMPLDLSGWNVDAAVCAGYKWLCGPVGTGFCWMKPELREKLTLNNSYWPTVLSDEDLRSEGPIILKELTSARKYDVFGTANFFNFVPFKVGIDYLLGVGIEKIRAHHDKLLDCFIQKLNSSEYTLLSPEKGATRSSLLYFSCQDKSKNSDLYKRLIAARIFSAFWKGNIRISPHIYNTVTDIDHIINFLDKYIS